MKHNGTFWSSSAFGQRLPRTRTPLLILGLLVAVLAVGCTGTIDNPEGWASPVGDGAFVVAHTESGTLTAFDLEGDTARVAWQYPREVDDLDLKAIYATPIIDRGIIYVASYHGIIVALDESTGALARGWTAPTEIDGTIVATPVLEGGSLFVATEGGDVFIVDTATGAASTTDIDGLGRIWGRPAHQARTLYVGDLGRDVHAIDFGAADSADAAVLWDRHLDGAVAGDLLIDGDLLFVGAFDHSMRALELNDDGAVRWTFKGDGWFWAPPAVDGSTVYASTVEGSVYAIDRATGDELWRFKQEDSEIRARPVLVNGVLVVAARDGFLFGIDPSDGGLLWEQEVLRGRLLADPLVLESGVLFVTSDGHLIRIADVQTGAFETLFDGNGS